MKKLVRKTYTTNTTWTCPNGVNEIRIFSFRQPTIILAGIHNSFVLLSDGRIASWGSNSVGSLGDNTTTNRSSPVLVAGTNRYISLNTSGGYQCSSIDINGDVYSWGTNSSGQFGNNSTTNVSSPVLVGLGLYKWRNFAVNQNSIFLDVNGNTYTCGFNTSGELGDNTTTNRSSPVLVVGGYNFKKVFCGFNNSYAITANNDAYAWGNNGNGRLGDNTTTNRSSPVLVVGGYKWKHIAGCGTRALGITTDDDAYAWGLNSFGELGDNTITDRSSPVLVVGGYKWKHISGGSLQQTTHGITTSGDIYGWGRNAFGQIGDNTTTNRSSPVLVVGGYKWKLLSSYGPHIIACTTNNRLYAWGYNASGQLGDNTTTDRSSPVAVSMGSFIPMNVEQLYAAEISVSVVPGTTYDVKIFSSMLSVGQHSVALGIVDGVIGIEYFA